MKIHMIMKSNIFNSSLWRTKIWTLRKKLIVGLSGMMLLFLLVALYNLSQVQTIKAELKMQNNKMELKLMALELKEMVQELNIIASGLEISKKTDFIPKYNEKRKVYEQMIKRIGETADTDEKAVWRSKLLLLTVDYTNTFDTASKLIQDNKLSQNDLNSNMEYLYNESQRLMGEIFGFVDNFYISYSKDAETAVAVTQNKLNTTMSIMIIALILTTLSGIVIAFVLVRSFTSPIDRLKHAVQQLSDGDLRHRINSTSQDELGMLSRSFDHMVGEVRSMLQNTRGIASSLSEHSQSFKEFSESTATANKEIVRAIGEISTGAEQQAHHSEQSSYILADLEKEIQNIVEFHGYHEA